jgi:soluble lytic murein transglycosylase
MISTQRGALRLILCLAAASAVTFAAPPSLRIGPTDMAPMSWESERNPVEDPLQEFDEQRRDPSLPPLITDGPRGQKGSGSKALAYAPPDGMLDGKASQELAPAEPEPLDVAILLQQDAEAFSRALAAYRAGDFAGGDQASLGLEEAFPRTVALWAGLRLHPREAGFARLSRFRSEHPNWPSVDWLGQRAEEALFGDKHPDRTVKAYFAAARPKTAAGKLALARVLMREGDAFEAAVLVKEVWREDDLGESAETAVKKELGEFLGFAERKYRADRLLYAEKIASAMRAAEYAGKDVVQLARARAAAASERANEKMFAELPPPVKDDPGALFSRIHTLRHNEKIAEAAALMRDAPRDPLIIVDGDAWWTERRLIARKLLDKGEYADAYLLCAQHSARSTSAKVEAEFHAGWIALRFLDNPVKAQRHFDLLAQFAETPIQKSRAAYWQGRAAAAFGTAEDQERARAYFERAAAHSTTYYGQLARAKLGAADSSPLRPPPKPAEGDARDEAVRAVELLFAASEKELAQQLAAEATRRLEKPEQVAALAEVTARRRDAKMSLTLGKLASYRGIALDEAAFPGYGVPQFNALPGSAPRAIVYAIARQESAFDPKAVSSAGAMGLMQMIASTARHTAHQVGVGFDVKRLTGEPAFNAQLGAAHLGILLGEHRGSYILTFAAYNAGGKRVKEWIDAYGDPRRREVDPIDWVERIPFSETRNYVQRVIENLVVYRARFSDRDTRPPQIDLAGAQ